MKVLRNRLLAFFALCLILASCQDSANNEALEIEKKIDELMAQMTLEEKASLIHASSSFTSGGVERLGIPELVYSDGPHGVRREHGRDWTVDENVYDSSTYLPVGVALASTWNPDLGYQFGQVLGSEARFRGKDVILGPGLNIIRSPLNGRNFEYLSEDPLINSEFVVGYIKGVQEFDVAACAKHYIANTYEYQREYVNVEMSDRALREIYLPGYKSAVQEGGTYTVMAAYNKFRGDYCAHSEYLLDEILKDEFGFDGMVVSDWKAVKDSKEAGNAGIDVEMGTDLTMFATGFDYSKFYMADPLIELVKKGEVEEAKIDAKVRRILRTMFRLKMFEPENRKKGEYNTKAHQAVTRAIADEAIVLLKNENNALPLKKDNIKKIAVIGANANRRQAGGGGSSQVKAFYEVTPLEGLKNLLGEDVEIVYAPGYEISPDAKANTKLIKEAVAATKGADAVVYVGGYIHGYTDEWNDNAYDTEDFDKKDMMLPFGQEELINALYIDNPDMVTVMVSGSAIDMTSWESKAKSLVWAWYAGMEGGNALADVLFGNINPSGKLPMTFPKKLEDSPAHSIASYPDTNLLIDHKEGIFVGYRYFDTKGVEPAYAFGHGLSYTTFQYRDLKLDKKGEKVTVSVDVSNTGKVKGGEVVQVYVRDQKSSLERPVQELKGFKKVFLDAGASETVTIELDANAFKYYDDKQQKWVLEPGKFTIAVGSSSKDIRVSNDVEM